MHNQADYEATQAARAFAAKQLQAAYPYLVACELDRCSYVQAAKNIRIELKRAFAGVKFSVVSKSYSGGNSIRVSWTDGPTSQQVGEITCKYSGGDFDGSIDLYTYSRSAWTDAFGDAKYIFCSRDYSDKMLDSVIGRVCRRLGGVDRSVEQATADYKAGKLWNVLTSGGCDLPREIGRALERHTYSIARAA